MSWEAVGGPVVAWAIPILLLATLLAQPSRRRVLTLDWPGDAIRVRSGRRERVLGLGRARAMELRHKSTGGGVTLSDHIGTRSLYWLDLVVWIEPDGGEAVPYALLSTERRGDGRWSNEEVEAPDRLAEALASGLGVPLAGLRELPEPFR